MTGTPMHMVQIKFFVPHITALEEDSIIWMQTGHPALHLAESAPGRGGRRARIGIGAGGTAAASAGIVHVVHCTFAITPARWRRSGNCIKCTSDKQVAQVYRIGSIS